MQGSEGKWNVKPQILLSLNYLVRVRSETFTNPITTKVQSTVTPPAQDDFSVVEPLGYH